MSFLSRIVYAAHASGTHHKLALDALRHLGCKESERWQKLFLAESALYLEGSKAPDREFRDFKNHVLHVRDDYWGGAPQKALNWYGHLVDALERRDWPGAAHCAGVLSHYYTDPIQPFHTAQSDAENAIHRAAEWSISKSYDELRKLAEETIGDMRIEAGSGPEWLADMVRAGADYSNRYYESLMTHYNIHKGVVEPREGLDGVSRRFLAELLLYAATGFAKILERAIQEAGVEPPNIAITPQLFLATLKIPVRWLTSKLEDAEDRRQVHAMYDELVETGRVEKTLTEDERQIRDLYRKEVLARSGGAPSPATGAASKAPRRPGDAGGGALPDDGHDRGATYVSLIDPVVDAPSIGPKTAGRLEVAGIFTIGDLLRADCDALAASLNCGWVKPNTVRDWQDQARLVCCVPHLRGGETQLLVGAGYRSAEQVAGADHKKLHRAILDFSETSAGANVRRGGRPPGLKRVSSIIERARSARTARAA